MEQSVAVKSQYNLKSTVNEAGTLNSLVHCFLLLCLAKMFICYTFFNVSESLSLALTAIMAVIIFLSVLFIFNRLQFSIQITWVLLLLFMFVSYLMHPSGLEYICNSVIFLGMLTILPYIDLKFRTVKLLGIIFAFYCVLVILFAPKFDSDNTSLFNLNTNTSGILLFTLEICFVSFGALSRKGKRLIFYILALLTIYFQFMFGARSSYVGTALIVLYLICGKYFDNCRYKSVRNLAFLICILSLLFVYFYSVVLFNKVGYGKVYILGKDIFTGRQKIWGDAFEQLGGHWLLGIGNNLDSSMGYATNLHNQMMGYLTCFGIGVLLTFVFALSLLLQKLFIKRRKNYCIAFIFALLIMSYVETNIYSSFSMFYIPIAMVILYTCDCKLRGNVK